MIKSILLFLSIFAGLPALAFLIVKYAVVGFYKGKEEAEKQKSFSESE